MKAEGKKKVRLTHEKFNDFLLGLLAFEQSIGILQDIIEKLDGLETKDVLKDFKLINEFSDRLRRILVREFQK